MGDRCNIVIQYNATNRIYFYGHWSGEDFVAACQRALKKRWRWDDPPYLARIIWEEFCHQHGGETGFGISPDLCDNEHDLCVVDMELQRVSRVREGDIGTIGERKEVKSWTFAEFIELPKDQLNW